MNNAIYFPGGYRWFIGDPSARIWQLARRLSRIYGHAQVVTNTKVTEYRAGKRNTKKLDVKWVPVSNEAATSQ